MQIYPQLVQTNLEAEKASMSYTTAATGSSPEVTEKVSEDSQALHSAIETLAKGIQIVGDELLSLSNDSLPLQQSMEKAQEVLSTMDASIKETNSLLDAIHSNISIVEQDLSSLKQVYEDQRVASYDGTFYWKITGVYDKMSKNFS